jgi:hypothetical protein
MKVRWYLSTIVMMRKKSIGDLHTNIPPRRTGDTEVEGILVTFVTCNHRNEYQKLQLGSGFKPTITNH